MWRSIKLERDNYISRVKFRLLKVISTRSCYLVVSGFLTFRDKLFVMFDLVVVVVNSSWSFVALMFDI